MLESFTIGSFEIPSVYIAIALALFISYLMIWNSEQKKSLFSHWLNAAIIVFIIFKITYIPFNWDAFIDSPAGLIYADGGSRGLLLGLLLMFIYLIYRSNSLFYAEAYSIFSIALIALYGVLELRVIPQWPYITLSIISLAALISMYVLWRRIRVLLLIFVTLFIIQLSARFFIYSGEVVLIMDVIQWWIAGSIIYVVVTAGKDMKDENGP